MHSEQVRPHGRHRSIRRGIALTITTVLLATLSAHAEHDGRWNAMGRGSPFTISGDKITFDEGIGFHLRFIGKRIAKWDFQGAPREGSIFQAVTANGSDLPAQWFCGAPDPVRYVVLSQADPQAWVMTLFRGKDVPQGFNDQACSTDFYQRVSQRAVQQDGMSGEELRATQSQLKALGYYAGAIDGASGPRTIAAIRQFQSSIGVEANGRLTEPERALLSQRATARQGQQARNRGPGIPQRFQGVWRHMEGGTGSCKASDWGSDRHSDTHFKVTDTEYEAVESVCRITGIQARSDGNDGPVHIRFSCKGEGNDFNSRELWQDLKIKGERILVAAPLPENDKQEPGYMIAFQKCE